MINSLYDALIQNPQCDLALCNYRVAFSLDEDTHVPLGKSYQVLSLDQVLRFDNPGIVYFVWNKLYRRSLIEGLFARSYRIAQDIDFNIRVFTLVNNAVFVESECYFWMQREGSVMHQRDYWYSYLTIVTDIYYRNYNEILDKNRILSNHLLVSLYWRLLSLKSFAWGTDKSEIVSLKCKHIIKETWRSYLCCRRVSLFKRLYIILLLCLPSVISHWIKVIRWNVKQITSRPF